MNKIKKIFLSFSTLFILAACGNNEMKETTSETKNQVEETTQPVDIKDMYSTEFLVAMQDAVEVFHQEFGEDLNIDSIEFELDNNNYVYDISGWGNGKEYNAKIDAQTAEILKREEENGTDEMDVLLFDEIISPQEAMNKALDTSNGEYIESWKLTFEDGMMVYEVEISGADDVIVNAQTSETRIDS